MTIRSLLGRVYRGITASRYSPLRPVAESIRFSLRMRRVGRAVEVLRAAPADAPVALAVIERIRDAWGNPGWTADAGFLLEVAHAVRQSPGAVLDCGSGLSTVICAVVAARHGAFVWSLEQERDWFEDVRRAVSALRLGNVRLLHTPLRSFGDFVWFDLGAAQLPDHFTVVSCDGPSVLRGPFPKEHPAWRSGLVSVLRSRGVTYDAVLLDDVEDPRFPALLERWRSEGLDATVIETPTGKLLRGSPRRS